MAWGWWVVRAGVDPATSGFQTGALPAELPDLATEVALRLAGTTGFEPATSGLTGRRTPRLFYAPWGIGRESD